MSFSLGFIITFLHSPLSSLSFYFHFFSLGLFHLYFSRSSTQSFYSLNVRLPYSIHSWFNSYKLSSSVPFSVPYQHFFLSPVYYNIIFLCSSSLPVLFYLLSTPILTSYLSFLLQCLFHQLVPCSSSLSIFFYLFFFYSSPRHIHHSFSPQSLPPILPLLTISAIFFFFCLLSSPLLTSYLHFFSHHPPVLLLPYLLTHFLPPSCSSFSFISTISLIRLFHQYFRHSPLPVHTRIMRLEINAPRAGLLSDQRLSTRRQIPKGGITRGADTLPNNHSDTFLDVFTCPYADTEWEWGEGKAEGGNQLYKRERPYRQPSHAAPHTVRHAAVLEANAREVEKKRGTKYKRVDS